MNVFTSGCFLEFFTCRLHYSIEGCSERSGRVQFISYLIELVQLNFRLIMLGLMFNVTLTVVCYFDRAPS